ncbi:MAG: helix-turn-helix domain-containing protein [Lachnospiraceae bacterium]|nr:helix-turn-helix domain-containing protein [Lachnospiraceae bacterium]
MNEMILSRLSALTEEEQAILAGREVIDRSLYMDDGSRDVITGDKLLAPGKMLAIRPHTRFVHFPEHSHDYVEMVYMCRGQTRHIVNGKEILLGEGELLMLGQNARQEILPAGRDDLAVNFIVRPEFFAGMLSYLGSEPTPLRTFVLDTLQGGSDLGFLFFKVADVLPVQNLIENLLWTLITETPNKRGIHQLTMGLLFALLLGHTEVLSMPSGEQETVLAVLRYIEERYRDGSLTEIAEQLHYEMTGLSRLIRQRTGKNYTALLQEKRLSQAVWLLMNTDRTVEEIAGLVGYENISYFYRLFEKTYGRSPRAFRICK